MAGTPSPSRSICLAMRRSLRAVGARRRCVASLTHLHRADVRDFHAHSISSNAAGWPTTAIREPIASWRAMHVCGSRRPVIRCDRRWWSKRRRVHRDLLVEGCVVVDLDGLGNSRRLRKRSAEDRTLDRAAISRRQGHLALSPIADLFGPRSRQPGRGRRGRARAVAKGACVHAPESCDDPTVTSRLATYSAVSTHDTRDAPVEGVFAGRDAPGDTPKRCGEVGQAGRRWRCARARGAAAAQGPTPAAPRSGSHGRPPRHALSETVAAVSPRSRRVGAP